MLCITEGDEKDEIMKAALELKIARIEDGYNWGVNFQTGSWLIYAIISIYVLHVLFCEGMR
jgi:hypothetical protein